MGCTTMESKLFKFGTPYSEFVIPKNVNEAPHIYRFCETNSDDVNTVPAMARWYTTTDVKMNMMELIGCAAESGSL